MDLGFWVGWFGWVGWLAAVLTENSCQQGMGYQSLLQFPPFIQENQLWLKVDLRHQLSFSDNWISIAGKKTPRVKSYCI